MRHRVRFVWAMLTLWSLGCDDGATAISGTQVRMRFARESFFAAPVPSQDLLTADGHIAIAGFPNDSDEDLVEKAKELVGRDATGFGMSSGVFFSLTHALDPARLPSVAGSMSADTIVFLMNVDAASPGYKERSPVTVGFETDAGPFGAPNLLSLVPYQGRPLLPNTLYAAVVLRDARDAKGKRLGVSLDMARLVAKEKVPGLSGAARTAYDRALAGLEAAKVDLDDVAGMTAFRTDDPRAAMERVREAALALEPPTFSAWQAREVYDDYCVYESSVSVPVFQDGTPPYTTRGGAWTFDASGAPVVDHHETARVFVTLPRQAPGASGFPLAVLVRTGAGGNKPLMDRGVRNAEGEVLVPGTGPALEFARAGFAGLTVEGPHGGSRNVSNGDEQFLMFNILNPVALRDNVRQSALELILLAHTFGDISIDASACAGLESAAVGFDLSRLTLMGHSMGASIAPLVLAHEPLYRATILSGAGASWLENILHKEKPVPVKPIAEQLIGYGTERALTVRDPVLSLVQWATEASDAQIYAADVLPSELGPRHVLMFQGVVDHYILPPIANALSVALSLDLAGPALDVLNDETAQYESASEALVFGGGGAVALPASGNRTVQGAQATAVVVQHNEDGVEDGHEVMFQVEAAKQQYRCFLSSFASTGLPSVCE